jgi:plasmid stabilization system protein ParE
VKVELSDEAQAEVERIDAWWRENRPAAPDLFSDELERALTTLGDTPALGGRYEAKSGVRRFLLRRTHYHLYFVERADSVYVVSVWSAYRGRGPKL